MPACRRPGRFQDFSNTNVEKKSKNDPMKVVDLPGMLIASLFADLKLHVTQSKSFFPPSGVDEYFLTTRSFKQACNLVIKKPSPLRGKGFLISSSTSRRY
jgi:hypothetical protein